MPSTHTCLHFHVTFSTKERLRLISPQWRGPLHEYVGGCIRGLNAMPVEVGGVDDHVHILAGLRPTECVADLVREVKKASTRWIRRETPVRKFEWQEGYGAFSVSRSHVHKKWSFQDEYIALLKRHAIEYDERFLW